MSKTFKKVRTKEKKKSDFKKIRKIEKNNIYKALKDNKLNTLNE